MQVTSSGHEPGVVFVPTVHDHETFPAPSVLFGSSPVALLGPDAYVTVIVQIAFGAVIALATAVPPRRTGLVSRTEISSAARTESSVMPPVAGAAFVAAASGTGGEGGGETLARAGVAALPPAHALATRATVTRTACPRLTAPSSLVHAR